MIWTRATIELIRYTVFWLKTISDSRCSLTPKSTQFHVIFDMHDLDACYDRDIKVYRFLAENDF